MKMKIFLFCVFALLAVNTMSIAQDSPWRVGFRLINVNPNDDSSTIGDTGTGVTVDDDTTAELDIAYFFTNKLSLEVIAGTTNHDIMTVNGALGGAGVGDVGVLPPTFTLQYHFTPDATVDFYAGVGLNYTLFYGFDLDDDLAALGVTDIDFDASFGPSGAIGVNVDLGNTWDFDIDIKYIKISTDAEIQLPDGGVLDTLDVDIDPIVIGMGFAKNF